MKPEKITQNRRLTKAYEVLSKFGSVPQFRTYQEDLIRIYYTKLKYGKGKTVPFSELSDDQIYRVAESLYNNALDLLREKTPEEKDVIRNLLSLEQGLKKDGDIESLDECICMQLESYPETSDLVREYNIIKGKNIKAKQYSLEF